MKKLIVSILLFMINYSILLATHNRAGSMTYRQLSGLTYEISIITYTGLIGGNAPSLDVDWGDGVIETVYRTSYSILQGMAIQKNIYTYTHTYQSYDNYTISIQDPNRNDAILNINNGTSINIPFYLESTLFLSNGGYNNSAEYLTVPILEAEAGKPFRYSLAAMDMDGDILTYELVTPKSAIGLDVPNYFIPDTTSLYYLNGELQWATPQNIGAYTFAIKVKEYRNNILVGTTLVDFQLNVVPPVNGAEFVGNTSWLVDANHHYSYQLSPFDTLQLSLLYRDTIATTIDLEAYSETLMNGNQATFIQTQTGTSFIAKEYTWIPNTTHARCAPYLLTFRGHSTTNQIISKDLTVMIWVRDSSLAYCEGLINQLNIPIHQIESPLEELLIHVYPNPFTDKTTIAIENRRENEEVTFQLFDVLGNQIFYDQINGETYTLRRNRLVAGLYFYRIEDALGNSKVGKIRIN
ncbi:T9SS type A sorting domain-containing protein [Aureispira anguillae]|uniref:T9SS type A sorting domain-containing protein n=1 Tax=Aureispira anguillae TaxID=2864201 RepID=A0A915YCE5_9BACT|nr:T9SS type A sorting domain-containing protein [Aureispira anguillae]BDS10505.1 T9SS type A sorting domain-containing protein [Aureispira anguillae]